MKVMKIGLLTLPLKDNYGGILQAVALYASLQRLGFEVVFIRKEFDYHLWKKLTIPLLELIPFQNVKKFRSIRLNSKAHASFIEKMIPNQTRKVVSRQELVSISNEYDLDAVVVGSDQVWRLEYTDKNYIGAYFLEFLENRNIRKVSYAASFGHDYWPTSDKVNSISSLLASFNAVSVRESSGVPVCAELGRDDAIHVLDPTILIGRDFFQGLTNEVDESNTREVLYYVLDESVFSEQVLTETLTELGEGVKIHRIYEKGCANQTHTIPEWVNAFREAEYVVTDSFHGMMFSVMFNKPFIVISNVGRGAARFESFLARVNLIDRLITDQYNLSLTDLIRKEINYAEVNSLIEKWRTESKLFLEEALK